MPGTIVDQVVEHPAQKRIGIYFGIRFGQLLLS
jgi:hypothetical protein